MEIPFKRLRRLRKNREFRRLAEETKITVDDFIYPVFIKCGTDLKIEIKSMPGIFQYSIDTAVEEIKKVRDTGIPAVILFGIPEKKDETGSDCYDDNGLIQTALRSIKKEVPDILCAVDLCMCEYTSHGHCGIIKNNDVDNDKTLELLQKAAVSYAAAGGDIIAPSGMMDGVVYSVREALDSNKYYNIPIMAYSAKYSSNFYGPFRDAAESPPSFGDRKTYQMNISNKREAMREIELDIEEGADIVMVKPALSYLDIIEKTRSLCNLPVAAYNVSGEYSMVKAAGLKGWINEKLVRDEILVSIKRAGADIIISYHAKEWAEEN